MIVIIEQGCDVRVCVNVVRHGGKMAVLNIRNPGSSRCTCPVPTLRRSVGRLFRDHPEIVKVGHGVGFRPKAYLTRILKSVIDGFYTNPSTATDKMRRQLRKSILIKQRD